MSRRFRTRLVGVVVVSACGFTASTTGGDGGTGGTTPDDSVIVDAPPDAPIPTACTAAGTTCVGPDERLRMCSAVNAVPVDTVCAWRCVNDPAPHCRKLEPAGGAVTMADMDPTTGLGTLSINSPAPIRFDTTTGRITVAGVTVTSPGVTFVVRNGVGIWRAERIDLNGLIEFEGPNPAAFVAIKDIQIKGLLDLQGSCSGTTAGVGGGFGGGDGEIGVGSGGGGAGTGSDTQCTGGGGGGHAAVGGLGGGASPGGAVFGTATVTILDGGGGGGGGGGSAGGDGGGGGGAIQLVANEKVRVEGVGFGFGGIQAGGCGGRSGSCGGGGGAGGTILIEAAVVEILNGSFTVNGGGGGGGKSGVSGTAAHNSQQRASGGNGGTSGPGDNGGDGGDGGDESMFAGEAGETRTRSGGGGGAVGWIRFNTMTGFVMSQNVVLSPTLSTTTVVTPVSAGSASLQ